jgi:large subunit ribosomal protein L4
MKLKTLTMTGTSSTITVSDDIFGAEVNAELMAQAVRVYRARLRQGTAKTKTRAEINRTHAKWFKQKGTGNARHGARTPNIFVGGGVSHGPDGNQNWSLALNQTMKHRALVSALSAQAADVMVATIPTDGKQARKLLAGNLKTLVILESADQEVMRGIRNMGTVLITTADRVNVLDVLGADRVVMSEAAIKALEVRLQLSAKAPASTEATTAAEFTASATKPVKKTASKATKSTKPATKKVSKKA